MNGAGTLIIDGTAVWIVDDIRDGSRVGDIIIRPTLRDGYVKANGATLKASEYPRLLRYAVDNNLTVTAAMYATDCSKYVYDSTADTLIVPNMVGKVLQGGDTVKSVNAGLPNITGSVYVGGTTAQQATFAHSGAFSPIGYFEGLFYGGTGAIPGKVAGGIKIDASQVSALYGASSTVQPKALQMIPQIKY